MNDRDDNPFVRFGLDPSADLAETTARLRALAEDASPDEQLALRKAWEMISRSPARRFELALEAGPSPSPLPPSRPAPPRPAVVEPTLADVLAAAPLAPELGPESAAEAALRHFDLSFLVQEDEVSVTGPLAPRRA